MTVEKCNGRISRVLAKVEKRSSLFQFFKTFVFNFFSTFWSQLFKHVFNFFRFFSSTYHSDQISEGSEVSTVTPCVEILKWHWPTDWLTHWRRSGIELPGQLKRYGHPQTKVWVSNHPDGFNGAWIFWSKTGLLARNESQHALAPNVEFLVFEQVLLRCGLNVLRISV